ncbi:TonB-dependent receptor plug domain-containing protein [Chitinolyticbacter meiyuanensis]|uniref:TonB-dependent receptor plug domain-containing protein n=1 Tax=Chitinolyticbacter meiyuanensis TaxID=682798 RepID=UPI001C9E22FB|nr:TonB-dependent receptor [Chitinolyticbacter meiyuanensis]
MFFRPRLLPRPPFPRRALAGLSLFIAAQVHADATLDTIVVTATRSEKTIEEAPVRTEVISRGEIERTHAKTLTEALENIPGLQLRQVLGKSGYELSLQGMTSDQVLVLIDGMPLAASTGSTVDLSQYLLAEVERIEVVKGAASAQYGSSAMGGVVNVITRRTQPGLRASVEGSLGSYGSQNDSGNSARPGVKNGQFQIEGGNAQWRLRVDGQVVDDDGFGVDPDAWTRQGDASRREQYGARLAWLPSTAGELWIEGSTYREDDVQRTAPEFVPPNLILPQKTEKITRDRLLAGGNWRVDSGLRVELKGLSETYDSHSQKTNNIGTAAYDDRYASQETRHLSGQVDMPAWYSQLWQFGFDLHDETLTQRKDGTSEFAGDAERSNVELFAQNDIIFNDVWEMVLGLRWQDDSDFGGHVAPKVALRGNVLNAGGWRGVLRASWGEGYRVPNLKERHYLFDHSSLGYVVIGNPDLKPESSNSWQLGGSLSWGDAVTLDANAFYNRVRDLIQVDEDNPGSNGSGVAIYSYENINRAETRGIELALDWRASTALRFNAAYTFTDTEDLATGQALTRRPRNMARLGADWNAWQNGTLSLRARYQGKELVDSARNAYSGAWTTVDLKYNHRLTDALTAYAGIDNLFDAQRDFTDPDDFGPVVGRYFYLGARYAWGH